MSGIADGLHDVHLLVVRFLLRFGPRGYPLAGSAQLRQPAGSCVADQVNADPSSRTGRMQAVAGESSVATTTSPEARSGG